jgi:hypothetical protein
MKQSEFNARFMTLEPGKDFDPPACETGLILLRRWVNQDPVLDRMLPNVPDDTTGPYAEAFYKHRNRCPKCNEQILSFTSEDPNFD